MHWLGLEMHPWPLPLPLRLPFWLDWKPAGNAGVPVSTDIPPSSLFVLQKPPQRCLCTCNSLHTCAHIG